MRPRPSPPLLAQTKVLRDLGKATGLGPLSLMDVEPAHRDRYVASFADDGDERRIVIETNTELANDDLTRELA